MRRSVRMVRLGACLLTVITSVLGAYAGVSGTPEKTEHPLHDEAFARLVDLSRLLDAVEAADAAVLADLAIQLAEAEHTLKREHKAITSQKLIGVAIRLAVETRDLETLDRLTKALTRDSQKPLVAQIELARKLAGKKRTTHAPLTFTEEQIDSGAYQAYRLAADAIDRARALADRERLLAIQDSLGTGIALSEQAHAVLVSRLKNALKETPEKSDEDSAHLIKLTDASRSAGSGSASGPITVSYLPGVRNLTPAWAVYPPAVGKDYYVSLGNVSTSGLPATNKKIWNYCKGRLGVKIGNGQCAAINSEAIRYATGKSYDHGTGPNYHWGTLIATLTPSSRGGASKILPGDLLQFNTAKFQRSKYYVTPNRWVSWSSQAGAPNHSAVVLGVKKSGTIIDVFEQNVNSTQVEMQGIYDLNDFKSGTIWVYRQH